MNHSLLVAALIAGALAVLAFLLWLHPKPETQSKIINDEASVSDAIAALDIGVEETSVACTDIEFSDPRLENTIRRTLGKISENLTTCDAASFTFFDAKFKDISDLSGIEKMVNLERLDLRFNALTDLSPLSGLTKLTHVWLSYNEISDVEPLSTLTNLQNLWLFKNAINDLTPLSNLTQLIQLSLDQNNITDVGPLVALRRMSLLSLNENNIIDIGPLMNLPRLQLLNLKQNAFGPDDDACTMHIPKLKARGVGIKDDVCLDP